MTNIEQFGQGRSNFECARRAGSRRSIVLCGGESAGGLRVVCGQSGDSVASVQRTVVALPLLTLEGGPFRILACTVLGARELRCELRRQSD